MIIVFVTSIPLDIGGIVVIVFFIHLLSPQIVSAVHYCHQKNIVHRDLKVT